MKNTLAYLSQLAVQLSPMLFNLLYDNEYASIIDIYFYESFLWNSKLKRLRFIKLDTLSDVLDKRLRFSLIKIESVSISQTKPRLVTSLSSFVYTFLLNSFN